MQAKEAYLRDLCLSHRISYTHIYLLSKIWYTAQIFPPPKTHIQQLTSPITLFIWKGAIFRLPISTLQAPKARLIDVYNKCKALLYCRMLYQSTRKETTTAAWLQEWNILAPLPNPPYVALYHATPIYTRMYAMDMTYI
jgi:hypothetical protein